MLNLEEYNATFNVDLNKEEFERLKSIVLGDDNIDDIQSIVAVKQRTLEKVEFAPVVRCKDCKHYVEEVGACIRSDIIRSDMRIIMPDWFCADGEVATVKDDGSKDSGDVKDGRMLRDVQTES